MIVALLSRSDVAVLQFYSGNSPVTGLLVVSNGNGSSEVFYSG